MQNLFPTHMQTLVLAGVIFSSWSIYRLLFKIFMQNLFPSHKDISFVVGKLTNFFLVLPMFTFRLLIEFSSI